MILQFLISLSVLMFACQSPLKANEPFKTVPHVDIERYMGEWFEIASFPQWFSRNCYNTTANYSLRSDGRVDVLNKCHKGSPTGEIADAKGIARVVNTQTNAELKVSFFWPFSGKYWIIDLGDNYEYAVVSAPSRDTLWILSRSPQMDQATLDGILERLKNVHKFDLSPLKYTRE
jgi:apolipoprotein D and lipocalin family protein